MPIATAETNAREIVGERSPTAIGQNRQGSRQTVIAARRGLVRLDLRELWNYRELLYFLVWRDIKVRYKQTALGVTWALLQPLALMIVFMVFMGRLGERLPGDVPYSLFLFAGLLPWSFFATAVSSSGQSVVSNQNLVTKVYFPRLLIPLAAVAAGLVDFAIGGILQLVLMLAQGFTPDGRILLVPVFACGLTAAAVGVGVWLSALTVAYRDFRHAVNFLMQIWMFATPAIYRDAASWRGTWWEWAVPLNPVSGFIINIRAAVLGLPFDVQSLVISAGSSLVLLIAGVVYFRRVERQFADII